MKYYVVLLNTILAFQVTRPIEAFSISISPALPVRIRTKSTLHRQANDNEDKFVSLGDDELDEATLAEVEAGKPSNWMVIQRVRK